MKTDCFTFSQEKYKVQKKKNRPKACLVVLTRVFYQKNDLEFLRLARSNNEVFILKRYNCKAGCHCLKLISCNCSGLKDKNS